MIGLTICPVIVSIFYSIGGYSLPYYICALICLFGIYAFYQVPQIDENFNNPEQLELMEHVNINSENKNVDYKNNKSVILILFKYPQFLLLTGAIIMESNSFGFVTPTLVNHLNETWNVSTSVASLFYLSSTISYAIVLQKIHELIEFFGNFPLISLGLILSSFTCFIIAPIGFLPHSQWTILTGLTIQGINGCFIIVPNFVKLQTFQNIYFQRMLKYKILYLVLFLI